MDTTAQEIVVLRKQVDRAYADWYSQRRDLNEFVQQFQKEAWHSEVKAMAEDYDTAHFKQSKKQKTM